MIQKSNKTKTSAWFQIKFIFKIKKALGRLFFDIYAKSNNKKQNKKNTNEMQRKEEKDDKDNDQKGINEKFVEIQLKNIELLTQKKIKDYELTEKNKRNEKEEDKQASIEQT
ncbi:hypothetical protein BpHYR1_045236, partial [Brachionus plicatilis]